MHTRLVSVALSAFVVCAIAPRAGRGQESSPVGSIPVDVVASAEREWVPAATSKVAPMQREIALELSRTPLAEALDRIAANADVHVWYDAHQLPKEARVSLRVARMAVAQALGDVLQGTGLQAFVSLVGRDVLVRPLPRGSLADGLASRQGTGTIAGHVTDATLKSPLSQVVVRVDGSTLSAASNGEGKYTIAGVAPGAYHVTARRVGYQPLTKDLTITADEKALLDFALVAAATRLDEIVTTAVGQQRRYEVGNTISTINADSIAPTAPITSLTDLISARAPGVTVLETSGLTGAGEAIRIRGLSSLVLQNDPILIVDGVRQDNSPGGDISSALGGSNSHPSPTRLNDIDFTDIATIDILKGPAASTEYGSDAASGVIVITTKHGTAGPPQWRVGAEQTESGVPTHYPEGYYSWGHLTDGTNTPVDCPLFSIYGAAASTTGTCAVDSVTRWNPLNHAATSIFGTGKRGKYDLSVSGGSDAVRYFVAGGLTNETGIVRMPPVFRELADTANVGLPAAALNPNVEQQRSVRANTAIKLGATADLSVAASYLSTYQTTPEAGALLYGVLDGPALSGPAHYYGYNYFGTPGGLNPFQVMATQGSQNTNRVTGGLTGTWRPTGWFVGHGSVGLDHGSQLSQTINYPLNPPNVYFSPHLGLANATTDLYSVDLRGTATASLARGLRAVTSVGLQMVDTRLTGQSANASNITATNLTLNGATGAEVAQQATRQATLGGYGEEELSVADRLFLTGALRIDAGSGFGSAYTAAAYPKASVSWLAVDNGATTVRVRGAFGEAGVQPMNGAALQLYSPTVVTTGPGGTPVSAIGLTWIGNPTLRPERSVEFEGGVDVGGWRNRLTVELTGYAKTTHDALLDVALGASYNNASYEENIGEVRNTGVEASATVELVQSRSVTWDVGVNASVNHNKLLALAPGLTVVPAQYGWYRQAVGYPLYGLWPFQASPYADANHDGIIELSEVTHTSTQAFLGPSLPTREASVSTHLGLWRGAVTVSGLMDYRGGYFIDDVTESAQDLSANSRALNDATAPIPLQARAVASVNGNFSPLYFEDGSFVRLREIGLTYVVPRRWLRRARVTSLSLTGAVRNLALWTRYGSADPETSNANATNIESVPTSGGSMVNNDVRVGDGTVPLARYWVVRLNVGF